MCFLREGVCLKEKITFTEDKEVTIPTMLHTWGRGCPIETGALNMLRALCGDVSVQVPESHQVTPTLICLHNPAKHSALIPIHPSCI